MRSRNRLIGAAALLIAAIFAAGIVKLFLLRFEGGDVYPAYSSFRTGPDGMKALYESLAAIPGATAARNLKPLESLAGTQGIVFYTGLDLRIFRSSGKAAVDRLEAIVKHGARLIVSFPED